MTMHRLISHIRPSFGLPARLLTLVIVTAVGLQLSAQRRVTPVQPTSPGTTPTVERERKLDRTNLVEMLDPNGNTILVDTVSG